MQEINDLPLWDDKQANIIIQEMCDKYQVPFEVLKELVDITRQHQHKATARGITDELDNTFKKMD